MPIFQLLAHQASANSGPVVFAGDDIYVDWANDGEVDQIQITLSGTVSDDGLPNPPGSLVVGWSLVSGPNAVDFVDDTSESTTATFFGSGVYILALTADDGGAQVYDELTITINGLPAVWAGNDRHTWPLEDVELEGTVVDDALPNPPAALSVTWSLVSGPGTVSFANEYDPATTATFSVAGVYVLRLTANDGALQSEDEVTLRLGSEPYVSAGNDLQLNWLLGDVSLSGFATDDGSPNVLETTWSVVSGPGSVEFDDANAVATSVDFSQPGAYVLRLTANDGAFQATDDVTVTVHEPPAVEISGDQIITLSLDADLVAIVSDDGLPDATPLVEIQWSVARGPGSVLFSDDEAATTMASFSAAGSYLLQLLADDGGLYSWDRLAVFVDDVHQSAHTGSVAVAWQPPTEFVDGTALTELAGFRIYYGDRAAILDYSLTISDPGATSHTVDDLGYGVWYIAVSAFTNAYMESDFDEQELFAIELFPDEDSDGTPDTCAYVARGAEQNDDVGGIITEFDSDGDGVGDFCDNCIMTPNPSQRDGDSDGHGNYCDSDFNNDGITNSLDLGLFKQAFFTADAEVDLNSDGLVNSLDLGLFKTMFLSAPGATGMIPNPVNQPPIPDAGPDQTVAVDETVTLDGTASSDDDGDDLEFIWVFSSVPDGSTATLSNPSGAQATFVADVPGTYLAELRVSDGTVAQGPDTVVIGASN